MTDTQSGTIKWFNPTKGFGFIIPDEGGPDVFLHKTVLRSCCGVEHIKEGEKVKFRSASRDGKVQASYVHHVDEEEQTRLRLDNERMRAALENMVGAFDNPVVRRRLRGDEFAFEAIASARAALSGSVQEVSA